MTPEEIFGKIWDILQEHAGARNSSWEKETFIRSFAKETTSEWRFQGHLGFGGKFYRNCGRMWISCYSEDRTAERQVIIDKVNELLREIQYFEPLPVYRQP